MRDGVIRAGRAAAPALLGLLLLLPACGTRISALYEKVLGSPDYSRVTESMTRTREVRDGIDTRFIISATWLSPAWVRAFSEEYARIYYLDAERSEQVVSRWRQESDQYVRFFVALFMPDERANDLDKPDTLWSLRLVGADEKDYQPVSIRRSGLRPEEIAHFFPYARTWFRAYEVAFPKEAVAAVPKPGSPRLKLVLSGVQGRAVLAWD
ncbi:MAG: hypothetical protein M1550_05955 [Deltaproteobacteria bacterium]|nr:hypothetical protein [Deltaproteobacteria bacterium]